jgi:hypothetical protein
MQDGTILTEESLKKKICELRKELIQYKKRKISTYIDKDIKQQIFLKARMEGKTQHQLMNSIIEKFFNEYSYNENEIIKYQSKSSYKEKKNCPLQITRGTYDKIKKLKMKKYKLFEFIFNEFLLGNIVL